MLSISQIAELYEDLENQKENLTERDPITEGEYSDWQENRITRMLELDVKMAQLDALKEALNPRCDREQALGTMEALEILIEWYPEGMKDEESTD